MRFILFFLLISFLNLNISITKTDLSQLQPKVIYGKDNRKEFYEVKNEKVKNLSLATVALFYEFSLNPINNLETLFEIDEKTLKKSENLCSTENYLTQPAGAFCSGFLIAPDLIMTAGHCIIDQWDCEGIKFVFDYKVFTEEQKQITIPKKSIYSCKDLIAQEQNAELDYSIIKLDRAVTDRKALALRTTGEIKKHTAVFLMGYPAGIPLKITQNGAKVSEVENTYFLANLDAFSSNSGSPVLNSKTHEVEGILVRGESDYKYNSQNSCYVANICSKGNNCSNEAVIKITSLQKEINNALAPAEPFQECEEGFNCKKGQDGEDIHFSSEEFNQNTNNGSGLFRNAFDENLLFKDLTFSAFFILINFISSFF